MEKRLVIYFAFAFLLLQFVNAVDTPIKIDGLPNYSVNINFLNPDRANGGEISFGSLYETIGESGQVTTSFSCSEESFDLSVFFMEGNKVLSHEEIEDVAPGNTIHMLLIPGAFQIDADYSEEENLASEEIEENISSEETEEITENVTELENNLVEDSLEEKSFFSRLVSVFDFSGHAVAEGETPFYLRKEMLYFLGTAFLLIGAGIFSFKKFKGSGEKKQKEINVKKLSEIQEEKKKDVSDYKQSLEDAERKLKEAQEELKRLKEGSKEEQIKKAKEKLVEDEKELMRLRKERD